MAFILNTPSLHKEVKCRRAEVMVSDLRMLLWLCPRKSPTIRRNETYRVLCSLPTPEFMPHRTDAKGAGWSRSQQSLNSRLERQGSPGQTGKSWQGRPRAFTSSSHQMCFQRNSASLITGLSSMATHGSQEVSPHAHRGPSWLADYR